MKIRSKMILLMSGVVFLSVIPLSVIMLWKYRAVLEEKTFEVCRNLGSNISNLAREELLIDETYDATSSAMGRLQRSKLYGLHDTYILNFDGRIVADLRTSRVGRAVGPKDLKYFRSLKQLRLTEDPGTAGPQGDRMEILRFSYPIFIKSFAGREMRVGTAVFEFNKEQIYQPVTELTNYIIIATAILLLLGLVIGLLSSILFAEPVRVLSRGAAVIGGGDLSHRIDINQKDELGDLARNFNRMADEIQDFTQNLERKVDERTRELNNTLQEVSALKEQQDGDYFLTSLLMKPFEKNNNSLPGIRTDFVVEQKKKFQFKEWSAEIGGDYCLTETLVLDEVPYSVFINADAMGKSIQGAGGALVLGTVFQSILNRTRLASTERVRPELWLRDASLSLQNIYASFQGSMYITVMLGLVDETGLMYYVNSEHPPPVLYRDGKAEFIERELWLRKMGTPGEEERFRVKLFQLQPGDMIISGSDGRDDFFLEKDHARMNQDALAFPAYVEQAEGRVHKIVELIKAEHELTDDVSIISITRETADVLKQAPREPASLDLEKQVRSARDSGDVKKALELIDADPTHWSDIPELIQWAAETRWSRRDYRKFLALGRYDLRARPEQDDMLLRMSQAFRRVGELNRAADYGECLRLRDPNRRDVLTHLAEIYFELGVFGRSEKLIRGVLDLDSDEDKARTIFQRLLARKQKPISAPGSDERIAEEIAHEEADKLIRKGDKHYLRGQYKPAMTVYRQLLKLAPENEAALTGMANCLAHEGRFQEARIHYNRALLLGDDKAGTRNNLAIAYYMLKMPDNALKQLNQAVKLDADSEELKANLQKVKSLNEDYEPRLPDLRFVEEGSQS